MSTPDPRIQPEVSRSRETRIQTAPTLRLPPDIRRPQPQRVSVLGGGLAVGAALAFYHVAFRIPPGWSIADRAVAWAVIMSGPAGMAYFRYPLSVEPSLFQGWLALFLIPAHPIFPNVATACLTIVGLAAWFFTGYLALL